MTTTITIVYFYIFSYSVILDKSLDFLTTGVTMTITIVYFYILRYCVILDKSLYL